MDELSELENAGWASLCDGTGADFYGSIMTDDGRMVLADGSVMSRDHVMASLGSSPTWASYSIEHPIMIPIGDDAAALVYTGTGKRDNQTFRGIMTSTYVRRGDGWKLALYQQTGTV